MSIVAKGDLREFQDTSSFDINLLRAVDQNVGDGRILEHRLQRPQSKDFVQGFIGDLLLFGRTQQGWFGIDQRHDRLANFASCALIIDRCKRFEVDLIDKLAVQS